MVIMLVGMRHKYQVSTNKLVDTFTFEPHGKLENTYQYYSTSFYNPHDVTHIAGP